MELSSADHNARVAPWPHDGDALRRAHALGLAYLTRTGEDAPQPAERPGTAAPPSAPGDRPPSDHKRPQVLGLPATSEIGLGG